MKLLELLNYGKNFLKDNQIDDFAIIAKILIEYVFGIKKEQIIISNDEADEIKACEFVTDLKKIVDGTPIQYITNRQEFMKLNFFVDENVLIPQPDTELLVEEIIFFYKKKNVRILDLCTGSGAIAISLAKYTEADFILATDISCKALKIAEKNAKNNDVAEKVKFLKSDLFDSISSERFDVIVSNPPYIKTDVISNLSRQVRNEPHIALDGGIDGLKFYRAFAKEAHKFLNENGKLFVEIGYDQRAEVERLFRSANVYSNIYCKKDYSGNDRIIVCEL